MTTKGRFVNIHTVDLGALFAPWSHCLSVPGDLHSFLVLSSFSSFVSGSFLFVGVLLFSQLIIILLLAVGLGSWGSQWIEKEVLWAWTANICNRIWIRIWWVWYLFAVQVNRLNAIWRVVAWVVNQWRDGMKRQNIFGLQELHGIYRLHLPKVEPFSHFFLSIQNCWHPKEEPQRSVQNRSQVCKKLFSSVTLVFLPIVDAL